MCPSKIRKLKVIVYFRKVFLLSKFKYFCFVTILDMSLISRSCKNDHITIVLSVFVADYVYFYYRIIIIINISGILWKILQKSMIWFLRKKYKIPLSPYIFIINILFFRFSYFKNEHGDLPFLLHFLFMQTDQSFIKQKIRNIYGL